ncbi:MAG: GNAT family N-acetyltransferase [Rhodothermales bacterium]|nr:GNAT family N-acetyltransferase [Rhodothermales bacterium]
MITYGYLDTDQQSDALALWNASVEFDRMTAALFDEKVFEDDAVERRLRFAAMYGDRTIGIAIGSTRSPRTNCGCIKLFCVHPDFRRQGIGTELVRRAESAFRTFGHVAVRLGESPPNYLQPGIDIRSTDTLAFVDACGFSRFGETQNLDVNLTSAELETEHDVQRLAQEGIRVERASMETRGVAQDFLKDAFPAWVDEIAPTFENTPTSLHIATCSAQVVAFAAYDANNIGRGWFGPMGTQPSYRGRGIGKVLLKRCLADLLRQGRTTATIPWVGPVDFYSKTVGAVVSRTFIRFEKLIRQ